MWYVVKHQGRIIGKSKSGLKPGIVQGVRYSPVEVRFSPKQVTILCRSDGVVGFKYPRQRNKQPVLPEGAILFKEKRMAEIVAAGHKGLVVKQSQVFIIPEEPKKPQETAKPCVWFGKEIPVFESWSNGKKSRSTKRKLARAKRLERAKSA